MNKCILVTGAAGFIICFIFCKKLLSNRINVIGLDNLNDYYDTNLKKKRLEIIAEEIRNKNIFWKFIKADLVNK